MKEKGEEKMKKNWLYFFLSIIVFSLLALPVHAENKQEEEQFEVVSEVTKYYKTVTYHPNQKSAYSLSAKSGSISKTYEISEEEYNAAPVDANIISPYNSASVSTNYKTMTTSIATNGSYYRYKNVLLWKNIPSTRSFDIMGIGHYKTVKIKGTPVFQQEYCYTNGKCYTSGAHSYQVFAAGVGTTFSLPTGDLSSLKQTFYFDVEKNTTLTLISQEAYGDYSHAQKSISFENAKKYSVNSLGIMLDAAAKSYYDEINYTIVEWNGNW